MAADYEIKLYDRYGKPLKILDQWRRFEGLRTVSNVGRWSLVLPPVLDASFFAFDNRIGVWRQLPGQQPALLNSTLFFIRRRRVSLSEQGEYLYTLSGPDLNTLPDRRIVAYYAGSAQAKKTTVALDDMIKAFVRENMGSLATDTSRSLDSTIFSVQPDASAAPTSSKAAAWAQLLPLLRELCQSSIEKGTYLAWDIVATSETTFDLRTYTGQRGQDLRSTNGVNGVVLSPERGNLENAELDEDATNEVNYVYAGGQGEGTARNVQSYGDTVRIGQRGPFGRAERFANASSQTSDTTTLLDEAKAAVRAGRVKTVFSGSLVENDSTLFDRDFKFGDYVSADFAGRQSDVRLDAISLQLDRSEDSLAEQLGAAARWES